VERLQQMSVPVLVLVVQGNTPEAAARDLDPIPAHPECFHIVRVGKAAEALARL
jgi:hypothetical protein